MCLGAIYWARPKKVYYANSRKDAADIGFDDSLIYDEINAPIEKRIIPLLHLPTNEALQVFKNWAAKNDKSEY
jgi:tRNA(Arg) A34 adenosine deaminase TadA